MADRICSCCGQGYTDDERHDYDLCYQVCQSRVNGVKVNLDDAYQCLGNAFKRRESQRKGVIH